MECYAFLETFRKGLFNDDIFGNVDWELLPSKTQKNRETNIKHCICQWKDFYSNDVLYTVEMVLKMAIQWY